MYKKILIINLMYIGDLLFTTPLLHVLHAHYPHAHITLLADKKNTAVVKYNPHISELMAIDKKGYHNKFSNYLRLIAEIRKNKYDLVINLHGNERASAIAAFSGADKIIGFAGRGFGFFFSSVVKERTDVHQVEAYLEVLETIGISSIVNQGMEMWIDPDSQKSANEKWTLSGEIIGLNVGGSWPTKRWTKKGFAELSDTLLEKGYGVAFFGGPMDESDVDNIIGLMKNRHHEKIAVFTGKITLIEMAALVRKCLVLITGDSGPMHIAVSQKVPVIGIFGPSDARRYAPYGQEKNVIRTKCQCQPCGKHSCDIGHVCMEEISSAMIVAKLEELRIL